jgi:L-tartrate/succinate antiporter
MMKSTWRYAAPLAVWLAMVLIPTPAGLQPSAWRYFALFAAVVTALIVEPIPAPAAGLLGVTIATVLRSVDPNPAEAIKWGLSGFSDTTVWLIFSAFVFSQGYEKTGLGRRIALFLVKRLGGSTLGLGYAIALADLLIAPFTPSNTGRSAGVIYPILRNIPALYGSEPGPSSRRIGAYLMWTAFATTAVTSSMFLTALAPNLLAVKLVKQATGIEITWTQWTLGFLPVAVVLLVPLPWLVYVIYPPEIKESAEIPAWAGTELAKFGRPSIQEWVMGILILLAFVLWVFGAALIHPTTVGMVVVCLMVLTGVLEWEDVLANKSAWGVLVWFATLITLAEGLNRVGVVTWIAEGVAFRLTGVPPVAILVFLVAFFFLVHYLFASITAHTTAVLPVVLAAGAAIPGMPLRAFVMLLGYSLGLMGVLTTYATGPAPVYYGSGYIPRKDFWILGLVFGLIFLVALLGIGLPFLLSGGS